MKPLAPRLHAAPRWLFWLLLLSGALLLGLCILFPVLGVLEWVAAVPSGLAILTAARDRSIRLRRMYGYGFCFFGCFYLVNFHWFLYMYPLTFAGLSDAAVRGNFLSGKPILQPLLFAALWAVREWIQASIGWAGVPWARLPLGQVGLRLTLQSAAFLGSYFVTFLLIAVSMLIADLLLHPDRARLCGILAGSLLVGNLALGGLRLLTRPAEGNAVQVAAIQGNMSSLEKWSGNSVSAERYETLTRKAAAEGATLIVWPETALTVTIDRSAAARDRLSRLARETGATLLVGVFTSGTGTESNRQYNSVVAFLPDGSMCETVYSKQKPVPFGEFVPYRELVMLLVPPLADIGMLENDLLVGDRSEVFDLGAGRVGSLICFDSIYESTALDSVRRGAQLLAVSTNDSWFQDSRGVWMHNAQSSLRAIETGRYVVRAGNTGVSSVIDPTGQVTAELDPLLTGYVPGTVRLCEERTLYTRIGNLFAYLCAALCAAAVLANPAEMVVRRLRAGRKSE